LAQKTEENSQIKHSLSESVFFFFVFHLPLLLLFLILPLPVLQMDDFKLVVAGDGAVGKTCMLMSYVNNAFPTDSVPRVWDKHSTSMVVDGLPASVGLWDTAGQSAYDRLRPLSYISANVVLIVFSVVSRTSFERVASKWVPELKRCCPDTPFVLVGNKKDLRSDSLELERLSEKGEQPVTYQEGTEKASKIGAAGYVECSALTQEGLRDVFDEALRALSSPSSGGGTSSPPARSFPSLGQGLKTDIENIVQYLVAETQEGEPTIAEDQTAEVHLGLSVGEVVQPRASVELSYRNEAPETDDKHIVVAFSFVVKDDVDTFTLGELSGSVKQMLGLASSPEFKYEIKNSLSTEGDGSRVFTLRFVWHSDEAYEGAQKVLQFYGPQRVDALIELNQAPGDSSDEFVQGRGTFDLVVARRALRFVQQAALAKANSDTRRAFGLMLGTKRVVFETHFDNLAQLFKEIAQPPPEFEKLGWATIPKVIEEPLVKNLLNPKLPEPIRTTYQKLEYLKALHSIRFTAGHHQLLLRCYSFDIFALLPTLDQLKAKAGSD
jgi:Ras-related C3 botulinum toxin substrate 1